MRITEVDVDSGRECDLSTSARTIADLTTPTGGNLDGETLGIERTVRVQRAIQIVFQDSCASLNPQLTVGNALTELLRSTASSNDPRTERAPKKLLQLDGYRCAHSRPARDNCQEDGDSG